MINMKRTRVAQPCSLQSTKYPCLAPSKWVQGISAEGPEETLREKEERTIACVRKQLANRVKPVTLVRYKMSPEKYSVLQTEEKTLKQVSSLLRIIYTIAVNSTVVPVEKYTKCDAPVFLTNEDLVPSAKRMKYAHKTNKVSPLLSGIPAEDILSIVFVLDGRAVKLTSWLAQRGSLRFGKRERLSLLQQHLMLCLKTDRPQHSPENIYLGESPKGEKDNETCGIKLIYFPIEYAGQKQVSAAYFFHLIGIVSPTNTRMEQAKIFERVLIQGLPETPIEALILSVYMARNSPSWREAYEKERQSLLFYMHAGTCDI